MKSYNRSRVLDPLRQLLRMADFLLLLAALWRQKRIPGLLSLGEVTFVELGPGPTRLAFLKRFLFRKVYFVDRFDFGIPDRDLRIINLEDFTNARRLTTDVCEIPPNAVVFLFADHCLEHLTMSTLLPLLESIRRNGFLACFRVPNILSPRGNRNFMNDPTHRTSFDPELRVRICRVGLSISPWMRWYRPKLILKTFIYRGQLMSQAEEITISTPARPETELFV